MASFKEAFAKARREKGPGSTFEWNGKKYTTNYKEETSSGPTRPKAKPNDLDKSKRPVAKRSTSKRPPVPSGGKSTGPSSRPKRSQGAGAKVETANAGASKPPMRKKSTVSDNISEFAQDVAKFTQKVNEWGRSETPFGSRSDAADDYKKRTGRSPKAPTGGGRR